MSEAVNFYKEPGEPLDRAAIDLGPYVPAPDDDVLVCRCEEVTKAISAVPSTTACTP